LSRIRLPPRVGDGEALLRPGVKDARLWNEGVGEGGGSRPCRLIAVAAPMESAVPVARDMVAERREGLVVGRHRMVAEEPSHHLPQPGPDLGDRLVHSPLQRLLDLLELRAQPISAGLPLDEEGAALRLAADEGEAQEVEGLRLAKPAPLAL